MFHISFGLDIILCSKIFKVCVKVLIKTHRVCQYRVALAFLMDKADGCSSLCRRRRPFGPEFRVPSAVGFIIDRSNELSNR